MELTWKQKSPPKAGGHSMIVGLVDQSRHRAARVQSRHHQRCAVEEAAMATRFVMRIAS
jgi:hypothetical protein